MMLNTLINWTIATLPTLKNEEGQDLAEYALVLVFVSIAAIVALTALGTSVAGIFTQITASLSS